MSTKKIAMKVQSHRHQNVIVGTNGNKRKIQRHLAFVSINDLPPDMYEKNNPRFTPDEKYLKGIYRDVEKTLLNEEGTLDNVFALKNRGLTIVANKCSYEGSDSSGRLMMTIDEETGGIVDGSHTFRIIVGAVKKINDAKSSPDYNGCYDSIDQEVPIIVYENVGDLLKEISEGLNTSVQVKDQFLAALGNEYDWIQEILSSANLLETVSFQQDKPGIEIREILSLLELFNIDDYPIEKFKRGQYPTGLYRRPASVFEKFLKENKVLREVQESGERDYWKFSKYGRMKNILLDILFLYDYVRRSGGTARDNGGAVPSWMEMASRSNFPFLALKPQYVPDKGIAILAKTSLYPILGSFRLFVTVDKSGYYKWDRKFEDILKIWDQCARNIMIEAMRDIYNNDYADHPGDLPRTSSVWDAMKDKLIMSTYQMSES